MLAAYGRPDVKYPPSVPIAINSRTVKNIGTLSWRTAYNNFKSDSDAFVDQNGQVGSEAERCLPAFLQGISAMNPITPYFFDFFTMIFEKNNT